VINTVLRYVPGLGWSRTGIKREEMDFDVNNACLQHESFRDGCFMKLGNKVVTMWAFRAREEKVAMCAVVLLIGGQTFCAIVDDWSTILALLKEIGFHDMLRNSLLEDQQDALASCQKYLSSIEDAVQGYNR
jgi:hypothetical protein